MLSTFIKLSIIIKIFVLSIFEWLFYTGFTVSLSYSASCRPTEKASEYVQEIPKSQTTDQPTAPRDRDT